MDVSWAEVGIRIGETPSSVNLYAALTNGREETITYLETLSEADLAATAASLIRWHESFGLPKVPRAEIFRSIAHHESYHTGQLVSYI